MSKQFFKLITGRHEIPLDESELAKAANAIAERDGVLVLKQGVVDLRSPAHIVPDPERKERYEATPHTEEKRAIAELPDAMAQLRAKTTGIETSHGPTPVNPLLKT